jgi:hypothetical protein
MSEELQVVEAQFIPQKTDALAINRAPDVVLEEARKAAKALTQVIEGKPKKIQFNGKTYLQFEDWQTLGRFYGVTAFGKTTKYIEFGEGDDKVCGFEATAEALLVSTNQVISSAEALCLNDEPNWSRKPLFQLKSMAQTRACAKVLRNVLAWVVVLAGYAPTPAEEMTGDEEGNGGIKAPQRRSQPRTEAPQAQMPLTTPLSTEAHKTASNAKVISEPQRKRLWAISKTAGVSEELLKEIVVKHGFQHSKDITKEAYGAICAEVETCLRPA